MATVMHLHDFARVPLAQVPTPLDEAPRLSAALGGPRILLKRDDLSGLALGGNKARKLELLLAEALAQGADTIITTGAADSNHCRMTAAAAARLGLKCLLLLGAKDEAPALQGNLLLDQLFGAEVCFASSSRVPNRNALLPELAAQVRARGGKPYAFPSGGSIGLGALGYALALQELIDQLAARGVEPDYLVCASGSGGTHAGLLLGAALFKPRFEILAVNVDDPANDELEGRTRQVYAEGAALLGLPSEQPVAPFHLLTGYLGKGYGVLTPGGAEAIRLLARTEGVLLDPVYTGKAMALLIDYVRTGRIGAERTVVFLHTGGAPALFTQAPELVAAPGLAPRAPHWWGRA
ncbi:MAG TPA: D-cysteine desulfhydrase family protein [Dehalococcoidia bacterium]|nr:D-cysteine desulfhydrase family protein [Dehalococcoidia bacterium]